MNQIEKVKLFGFWNDFDFEMDLSNDINFLIGVNGTGKTTVVNIITAVLTADFFELVRLPFNKVIINLKEFDGLKKPSIEVEKFPHKLMPYPEINVRIKNKASGKAVDYSMEDLQEERIIHTSTGTVVRRGRVYGAHSRYVDNFSDSLIDHINSLINVSWLSIHRAKLSDRIRDDKSFESSVDQKLDNLSDRLVRHFSQLDKKIESETKSFEEQIFLSLLTEADLNELYTTIKTLDLGDEKKALNEIFELFGMRQQNYKELLDKKFRRIRHSTEKLNPDNEDPPVELEDILSYASLMRIHSIIKDYKQLINKQNQIFILRDKFIELANNLLNKKELIINDKNEIQSKNDSGDILPLQKLSSGEKQLIIFLGECLLQEMAPWIYIADEPELSLHVKWQSKLIETLKSINPNAQIIFATHSPDILGGYESNVIDMEKMIS